MKLGEQSFLHPTETGIQTMAEKQSVGIQNPALNVGIYKNSAVCLI